MSLNIRITAANRDSFSMDLCGEALTSSNPPLASESRDEIAKLRSERIKDLSGADGYQAGLVFDCLESLPPIEGPRTSRLLRLLADSDFTLKDVESALKELNRVAKGPHPFKEANDWGYISFPATPTVITTGEKLKQEELHLDAKKASQLGTQALAEIYVNLSQIDSAQIRRNIIDDCCAIIKLRLHFEF